MRLKLTCVGEGLYTIDGGATVDYNGERIRVTTRGRRPTEREVHTAATVAKGPWVVTMDIPPKLAKAYGLVELRRREP